MAEPITTPADQLDPSTIAAPPGVTPQHDFGLSVDTRQFDYKPEIDDHIGAYSTLTWSDLKRANDPVSDQNGLLNSIVRQIGFKLESDGVESLPQQGGSDELYTGGPLFSTIAPQDLPKPAPKMEPDAANIKYGVTQNGKTLLKFDQPVTEYEAATRAAMMHNEIRQAEAAGRASSSLANFSASAVSGLGTMVTDPTNLLALVPILGQAKWAVEGGLLLRSAALVADNAIINTAFAVPPHLIRTAEGTTETHADLAQSILIGTMFNSALGMGLHGLASFYHTAAPETHQAALQTAIAQAVDGKPVNIADIYKADLLSSTSMSNPTRLHELADFIRNNPAALEPGRDLSLPVRGMAGTDAAPVAPKVDDRVLAPLPEAQRLGVHDTLQAAQRAAKRYRDEHGVEAQPVQTDTGKFVLARRIDQDLVRDNYNETLTFSNERSAQRYIDQIIRPREELKGPGADNEIAPKPTKYDVVPVGRVGERGFAILKDADERTITNWRKYPEVVSHEKARVDPYNPTVAPDTGVIPEHLKGQANRPLDFATAAITSPADDLAVVQAARAKFERDLPRVLEEMRNPTVEQSPAAKAFEENVKAANAKAGARKLAEDRPGGSDQIKAMQADAESLKMQVENVSKVGELDDKVKAELAEANNTVKSLKQQGEAMDVIAACMR